MFVYMGGIIIPIFVYYENQSSQSWLSRDYVIINIFNDGKFESGKAHQSSNPIHPEIIHW